MCWFWVLALVEDTYIEERHISLYWQHTSIYLNFIWWVYEWTYQCGQVWVWAWLAAIFASLTSIQIRHTGWLQTLIVWHSLLTFCVSVHVWPAEELVGQHVCTMFRETVEEIFFSSPIVAILSLEMEASDKTPLINPRWAQDLCFSTQCIEFNKSRILGYPHVCSKRFVSRDVPSKIPPPCSVPSITDNHAKYGVFTLFSHHLPILLPSIA